MKRPTCPSPTMTNIDMTKLPAGTTELAGVED